MFALRTLRELKLLRFFAENQVSENLITVVDLIKPPSYDAFQEVFFKANFHLTRSERLTTMSAGVPHSGAHGDGPTPRYSNTDALG